MGAKPKTVSLSDNTFLIAKKIEEKYHSGFSGWLRAMIRQWDEGNDSVRTELFAAALRKAVARQENSVEIFTLATEIREQASLGDFE